MRQFIALAGSAALLATPMLWGSAATAAPGDRVSQGSKKVAAAPATAQVGNRTQGQAKPAARPMTARPAGTATAAPAQTKKADSRTGRNTVDTRGNNDITINKTNNVNVSGNNRYPNSNAANRYPVYRAPNGSYYRPPNGGYYRPPPPPPGGWGGGYYPPPSYFYDDGPSVGDVIAGVAVTGSLIYLLSQATKPKQQPVVVQGGPPMPPPPPPQPYVPPQNSTGKPALVNVDINGLTSAQRPSASVCITEAARQIGATGGTEIRVKEIIDVEEGNGGYRFRLVLLGIYPDETRTIPMYCRATPEKIVELTFG